MNSRSLCILSHSLMQACDISNSLPKISYAFRWFQYFDTDGSGTLEKVQRLFSSSDEGCFGSWVLFFTHTFPCTSSHSILLEQISLHAPSSRGSTSPRLSQGEIVRALIKTLGLSEDLRRLEEMRETVDQVWGARRYFASPCALRYFFRKGKGGGWGYIPLQVWARLERHAEADPARMSIAFYTL